MSLTLHFPLTLKSMAMKATWCRVPGCKMTGDHCLALKLNLENYSVSHAKTDGTLRPRLECLPSGLVGLDSSSFPVSEHRKCFLSRCKSYLKYWTDSRDSWTVWRRRFKEVDVCCSWKPSPCQNHWIDNWTWRRECQKPSYCSEWRHPLKATWKIEKTCLLCDVSLTCRSSVQVLCVTCDTCVLHDWKASGQRTLRPEALGHMQLCVDFAEKYSSPCESMWKHLVTCVKCRLHSLNVFKCIMSWNTRPNKRSWETQILGCKNWRNSFISCTSRRTKRPGEWLRNVEQESVSASKMFCAFWHFSGRLFSFCLAASWNMQHMKSV